MREEEEGEDGSESEQMKPREKSGGGDTKRRRTGDQESPAGLPEQGIVGREAGATSDPCVSLAFRVETKQGVALRNHQLLSGATPGLSLSFVTKVTCLGKAQRWDKDPRNGPLQERECDGPHAQVRNTVPLSISFLFFSSLPLSLFFSRQLCVPVILSEHHAYPSRS